MRQQRIVPYSLGYRASTFDIDRELVRASAKLKPKLKPKLYPSCALPGYPLEPGNLGYVRKPEHTTP